ncbi:MAG: SDR family oxidoreductase [Deltaproteobacteria bacterium]|jgi:3alpha(or 20beta)-hydroxysteroid dehydrogenase|nr:SDR family oxidoreductase [Deltaproteobacteria bacterium]
MGALGGKTVIVTGAARGVGATLARSAAEEGAVVVLGDILVERGESVAKEIGQDALFLPLDVTSEEDWTRVVDETRSRFGRIDGLVNNAAVLHIGTLENTPPEAFRRVFEVNTLGPYLGTRAVLPTMKAQAAGSIVHISSIDGLVGMNGVSAYASSKWGLRGLAKASAMELGRSGIRVNTICPASGNAEMFDPWQEKMASFPDDIAAYLANRAMPGELPAEAVAGAVNYLLSDTSRHVTGIDLPVDAGATVGRFLPGFNTL